jgi:hypothetical protein
MSQSIFEVYTLRLRLRIEDLKPASYSGTKAKYKLLLYKEH